jgi:aerobic carbon-monoxide dehydrogenase large subunit
MTTQDATRPALVGARVPRVNDPRMLAGGGRYVDDIQLPGMLHAHVVRSTFPAATITSIDSELATGDERCALVLDALDHHGLRDIPCVWLQPGQCQTSNPVMEPTVRYVGQPIGIVVAPTREDAEDLAESVEVVYEQAPVVRDAAHGLEPDAPFVNAALGSNVCVELTRGSPWAEVAAHIESAAHVVRRRLRIQRVAAQPVETRGVVASWEVALERLTVWISTQAVHHVREHLAHVLGLDFDQIRVIAPDIGGAFGSKEHLYPDEVLACAASIRLGCPVKWIEDRYEHFTATLHARDQVHDALLALDSDGRFLALWSDIVHDLGAHPSNVGSGPAQIASTMLQGPYHVARAGTKARCVLSNRTPTGAYRGFGMQQAAWVRERLVDEAARELGVDPVDLRRRNMIRSEELPHTTHTLQEYDSGDYVAALDDIERLVGEWMPPSGDGRRRGIGYASHVEFTGLGPSKIQQVVGFELNGFERSVIRVERDGSVTVATGGAMLGQGLETGLSQLAADALGVPIERVRIVAGDSDRVPYSSAGSIASRAMTVAGGALVRASRKLRGKVAAIAAHQLEANPDDIELADGQAFVQGVPARSIELRDLASAAWLGWDMPDDMAPGLEEQETYDPSGIAYSYATHAAAAAVDLDTGVVELEGYWVVHDCGTVVNPMIADGQIQGGVAQGIGVALYEDVAYQDDGQPAISTYMDYIMPLASDVPEVQMSHYETPSPHTPGGMKGLGEGGVIPAPAAIANAICAAVPEIAADVTQTPLSPSRLWTLIHEAGLHD